MFGWVKELFGADGAADCDSDIYSTAALDELYKKISSRGWWPAARAEQQAEIDRQRARALAMPDPKWRKAYLGWIDYFQNELTKEISDDEQYEREKPLREAEDAKERRERERVRLLCQTNPPDGFA